MSKLKSKKMKKVQMKTENHFRISRCSGFPNFVTFASFLFYNLCMYASVKELTVNYCQYISLPKISQDDKKLNENRKRN